MPIAWSHRRVGDNLASEFVDIKRFGSILIEYRNSAN